MIVFGIVVLMLLVGTVLLIHFTQNVPVGYLTRDPNQIGGLSAYAGFLSQFGIFLWSSAATISFMSFKNLGNKNSNNDKNRFWLSSGLFFLMLGFDDVFLLHERIFPRLGMPETLVLASYFCFIVYYIVRFKSIILTTDYILFFLGISCLGISALIDVFDPNWSYQVLYEDSFKSAGQIFWIIYVHGIYNISHRRNTESIGL